MGGSAVRFFLARALSPRVQVNARWIGINAATRKAFAISGKEPGCPLLAQLAEGGAGQDMALERARASLGLADTLPDNHYLTWFRTINAGYPFLDYSKEETRTLDADLMEAYAAAAPPPPLSTGWSGDRICLPQGRLDQVGAAQEPSIDLVSAWLRLSAGITHTTQLRHSVAAFRTSPSGGARHPTDIGVRVGDGWPSDLAGSWWYDGLSHEFVRSACEHPKAKNSARSAVAIFPIASHVRRAMWRYRDARAIRPVAIDAGHVVETLVTVIQASGWTAWWDPTPGFVNDNGDLDPVFGYVIATRDAEQPQFAAARPLTSGAMRSGRYRTNPFISLIPGRGGITGENHLRNAAPASLSSGMIDALAWSIPSSRRDRPTTHEDLLHRFLTKNELNVLLQAGLLLDEIEGDALWREAKTWFDHDWYLSLLVLAT